MYKPFPELDAFTMSYLEAALWSSHDEADDDGGEPMDENYGVDDLSRETIARAVEDCRRFREACEADITEENYLGSPKYTADEIAGHDFWLTRNGHGAGFWDGDWEEEAGDRMTEVAKSFGEVNLYVGDDGEVHSHAG